MAIEAAFLRRVGNNGDSNRYLPKKIKNKIRAQTKSMRIGIDVLKVNSIYHGTAECKMQMFSGNNNKLGVFLANAANNVACHSDHTQLKYSHNNIVVLASLLTWYLLPVVSIFCRMGAWGSVSFFHFLSPSPVPVSHHIRTHV